VRPCATTNGSARAGNDYTAKRGTVTIAAGQLTNTIVVNVTGDTLGEANETFFVDLSSPVHADIADARGIGTILNND
jgi:chitinase